MTSSRRGTRRRRPVLVSVSALVVAAGSVAITVLGGFAEAPEKPPPAVRPGEEIDQDLFRTTVVDAVVRTLPGGDAGGAGDAGASGSAGAGRTVLDVTLKVFNNATSSAPMLYLERSLLRVAPPEGRPLLEAPPSARGGGTSATPSPDASEPAWRHETFIPAQGVDSRLLPPQLTSTVVLRFSVRDGLTPPERLVIDFGAYELYQDWFTKRTRPELVVDEDEEKVVAARVTLPVKRGEG